MASDIVNEAVRQFGNPKPSNAPAPTKKAPVIEGKAGVRKGSLFKSALLETVTGVWKENIIPNAKNMFVEAVTNAANKLMYGESRPSKSSGITLYGNRFKTRSERERREEREDGMPVRLRVMDYDYIEYDYYKDAVKVLEDLIDEADGGKIARVSDFYEFSGINNFSNTCNSYGWTKQSLERANVRTSHGKWVIDLPKPMPID